MRAGLGRGGFGPDVAESGPVVSCLWNNAAVSSLGHPTRGVMGGSPGRGRQKCRSEMGVEGSDLDEIWPTGANFVKEPIWRGASRSADRLCPPTQSPSSQTPAPVPSFAHVRALRDYLGAKIRKTLAPGLGPLPGRPPRATSYRGSRS